jgi:hypothetical protein
MAIPGKFIKEHTNVPADKPLPFAPKPEKIPIPIPREKEKVNV